MGKPLFLDYKNENQVAGEGQEEVDRVTEFRVQVGGLGHICGVEVNYL